MSKRKAILFPSVKFAIFYGDKKLTKEQRQEVRSFAEHVEKEQKESQK